jgi:RNA polymerase sigma-70 factor, ECF subfamily
LNQNHNEEELICRILQGDNSAFEQIIGNYQHMVYHICLRFMKNNEDAEDTAQEVFIKIYKNIHKFKSKSSLATWIYKISVNVCLNKLKSTNKYKSDPIDDNDYVCRGLGPDEVAEINEEKVFIFSEINKLNSTASLVVRLRLFGDKSFNEIAKLLNIPASTARTSFTRSRDYLKKSLANFREE